MLFLVVIVMFMPAVFFIAGIGYVIPKLFVAGHTAESFSFILILGLHVLVYAGVYYTMAVLVAKGIIWFSNKRARNIVLTAICLGLGSLTQLPIYGGGGHGRSHWSTLNEFIHEINTSYGAGTGWCVYGSALLIIAGFWFFHKRRHRSRKTLAAGP